MTGNMINPDIFSVYRGKRVYFCCLDCKERFEADPEKHLARLPQFAAGAGTDADSHKHAAGFGWGRLLGPLGITTLVLLLLTASTGLLRRRSPRELLRCHKVLAALAHATLGLLFH